jgi:hypothetical protein
MIFVIGMQNKSKENDGLRNVTRSGVQHYAYLGRWGPTLDIVTSVLVSFICIKYLSLRMPASVPEGMELDPIGKAKVPPS